MAGASLKSVQRWLTATTIAVGMQLLTPLVAQAEPDAPGWREVWTGVDASRHVWLTYGGVTVAPHSDIFSEGLRLRVAGGYGGYTYEGERRGQLQAFNARTAYAEALVGYYKQFGPLFAKGFVGVAAVEHDVDPIDPENPVQGQEVGPKLVAEFWLNMGGSAWSQVDLSWTSAHQTAAARLRAGYRIWGDLSIGPEGGINSNDLGEDARAGLFARYAWAGGEFSLAGGFAGRFLEDAQSLQDPYANANWLTQF
jgi:hypothetical protein